MNTLEIFLSKNDLEHIANGYDLKIKVGDNEIILKPALMNDLMNPLLNYRYKIIDTGLQNVANNFMGGAR